MRGSNSATALQRLGNATGNKGRGQKGWFSCVAILFWGICAFSMLHICYNHLIYIYMVKNCTTCAELSHLCGDCTCHLRGGIKRNAWLLVTCVVINVTCVVAACNTCVVLCHLRGDYRGHLRGGVMQHLRGVVSPAW